MPSFALSLVLFKSSAENVEGLMRGPWESPMDRHCQFSRPIPSVLLIALCALVWLASSSTHAGGEAKITHTFLATGGQTYIVGGDGKIAWQYPHSSRDGWVLPNGNVVLALSQSKKYPGGAVVEVT